MEKKSKIKSIKFVNGWRGNEEVLFFHELIMENGDTGKLDVNNEERPLWLQENAEIFYDIRDGKRGRLIKFLGLASGASSSQSYSANTPAPIQSASPPYRTTKQNNDRQNKYSSDPDWRETQQKCISMTTCLDRANELVIAGKIALKDKYDAALQDFDFIRKHAGLESDINSTNHPTPINEPLSEMQPAQPIQPNSQPALFENEDAPVSEFISQSLLRCKNKKQLDNLKSQLTEEEKQNKNVIVAFHTHEQSFKKSNIKK